jgi:hypothetical protein
MKKNYVLAKWQPTQIISQKHRYNKDKLNNKKEDKTYIFSRSSTGKENERRWSVYDKENAGMALKRKLKNKGPSMSWYDQTEEKMRDYRKEK